MNRVPSCGAMSSNASDSPRVEMPLIPHRVPSTIHIVEAERLGKAEESCSEASTCDTGFRTADGVQMASIMNFLGVPEPPVPRQHSSISTVSASTLHLEREEPGDLHFPAPAARSDYATMVQLLQRLPPTPPPRRLLKCSQATIGISLTIAVAVSCLLGTWWMGGTTLHRLVSAQVGALLGALAHVLFSNPGVIKRDEFTTWPLPQQVAAKLHVGEDLSGLTDISGGEFFGRIQYCVKCCVWRRHGADDIAKKPARHCATCNRCVRDFHHHSRIFGRCIAGSGLRGNLWSFRLLSVMLFVAVTTTLVSCFLQFRTESVAHDAHGTY